MSKWCSSVSCYMKTFLQIISFSFKDNNKIFQYQYIIHIFQDPELRKKFAGKPEYVVNYLFLIAEDVNI